MDEFIMNQNDMERMLQLGFYAEEVQMLNTIIMNGGSLSPAVLSSYNFSYEQAMRLRYMLSILKGKEVIESTEDLAKHFRKLNGNKGRISISNLPLSRVSQVPRLAVIAGLPKGSYQIYNSSGKELKIYHVIGVNNKKILIQTKCKPVLVYGSDKKLYYIKDKSKNKTYYTEDGSKISRTLKENANVETGMVLEIKNITEDKREVEVAVNRDYIRLINRYIILCSLHRPEFHIGLYEIVLWEGTKLYIFAAYMGKGEAVSYNNAVQRIYSWGFKKERIPFVLKNIAQELYKLLNGVFVNEVPANTEFSLFEMDQNRRDRENKKDDVDY